MIVSQGIDVKRNKKDYVRYVDEIVLLILGESSSSKEGLETRFLDSINFLLVECTGLN